MDVTKEKSTKPKPSLQTRGHTQLDASRRDEYIYIPLGQSHQNYLSRRENKGNDKNPASALRGCVATSSADSFRSSCMKIKTLEGIWVLFQFRI